MRVSVQALTVRSKGIYSGKGDGRSLTRVSVQALTVRSRGIFRTLALIVCHFIHTGPSVVAGVVGALIYIHLTQHAFVPLLTDAVEVLPFIHTPIGSTWNVGCCLFTEQ